MLKRMRGRKVALAGAHEALATVDLHKGQTSSALLPSLLHAQAGLQPRYRSRDLQKLALCL